MKDKRAKRVIEEDRQAEVLCHGGPTPLAPDGAFGQDVTWKGATTVLSLHPPPPPPLPAEAGVGEGEAGSRALCISLTRAHLQKRQDAPRWVPGAGGPCPPSFLPRDHSQGPPRSPEVDSRSRPRAARGSEARIRADAAWVLPVTLQDEIIETMVPKK